MSKHRRRGIWLFIITVLLFTTMLQTAEARVSIEFDTNGDLVFTTADTTRTPTGKYQIVGWIVRKERHCQDPRLEIWNQQCDPFWDGGAKAIFRNFATGDPVKQRGRVYTTYRILKSEVDKQFGASGFGQLVEGQELYFSPIMKILKKNEQGQDVPMQGEYLTLADVRAAEEWKSPSVFRQFYDIPVRFTSSNPLYVIYRDEEGRDLKEPVLVGKYAAGAYPGRMVLDRQLEVNGATLQLRSSWLERIQDPLPRPRSFEVGASVTSRNFTVAYGGTNLVAVYDGDGARVDAKFVDEKGNVIQNDAYVGNYPYGEGEQFASYLFPATLHKESILYDLIRTYTTTREPSASPTHVQTAASTMRDVKLRVGPDGHYMWGVYRPRAALGVAVDLNLHVPQHIPGTQTNVSGILEAVFNSNTELESYEIVELSNATVLGSKSGKLEGKSSSIRMALEVPTSGASTTVAAKIRVYGKDAPAGEDFATKTILKNASGGVTSLTTDHETVIKAMSRGGEQFDVAQGIPGSESLYANLTNARSYLHEFVYKAVTGVKTYSITVRKSYTPYWYEEVSESYSCLDAEGKESTCTSSYSETVYGSSSEYSRTYSVRRPYTYYIIDKLAIYGIRDALLRNLAMPGGQTLLQPHDYTAPTSEVWHSLAEADHAKFPVPKSVDVDLGSTTYYSGSMSGEDFYSGFESTAESQVGKVAVRNDKFIFNVSTTVMDPAWMEEAAPMPGTIPEPTTIHSDVLYEPNLAIQPQQANNVYESTGTLTYSLTPNSVNSTTDTVDFELGPNSVTVHTPVVNDSEIPDTNRGFDQRMKLMPEDLKKHVLVLDRPFTVQFDETAMHMPFQGYGDRDYAKYTVQKRVIFPFGVYDAAGITYYPEQTPIDFPVGQDQMDFIMPTWIDEGDYQVRTEAWAINEPTDRNPDKCQMSLNGDRRFTCASNIIDVGVTGRVHSFRVTDIGDFRFESVFRKPGTKEHTGQKYVSGANDPNGIPQVPAVPGGKWVLPIRHGSHPEQLDTVAHNGYPISFDFKTIGNYWHVGEGIRIEPTFWFVKRDGTGKEQVDLYYNTTGDNKLIKVGSEEDKRLFTRSLVLAAAKRDIPKQDLENTAKFEFTYLQTAETDWNKFYRQFLERKTAITEGFGTANKPVILPYRARVLEGLPAVLPGGVDRDRALRSVQHWFGEYHVPISPYILKKDTDIHALAKQYGNVLTGVEPEFLKDGNIIVNFGIYTVRNNDEHTKLLGYKTPNTPPLIEAGVPIHPGLPAGVDMWSIEGQVEQDTDSKGNTFFFDSGDIILYESDYSASHDFRSSGN
ncbi:DUF5704 domain-containing protein [Paenibacillus puerhi]|uniref:DUF5704 domain-containing protein n=1 Tax=Paenibacillus puerhi TaxID=2692622 RepID=UPI0013592442|nr:DUF5704 domain-containing protein [Paenibacillus puerhi]